MDNRCDLFDRWWSSANLRSLKQMYPQNLNQPLVAVKLSGHRSAIRVVLSVVAVLFALLLGLIVLLLIGFEAGPLGLLIGFIVATLPVPFYIGLVLWIDR